MKLRQVLISGWVALALMLIGSTVAGAEVVGRLTQLEGRVDLLKGGKLPAVALKVNDTVEPGDVIRTKSLSKAQITFIDDSLLTLSQEARIAIEEFKFEPSQGKRQAVLEIFQGLALAVVNKILKAEEPDFVIKTQTAIVGVRGTEIGMRNPAQQFHDSQFSRPHPGGQYLSGGEPAVPEGLQSGLLHGLVEQWLQPVGAFARYAGNHSGPESAPDRAL